MVCRQSFIWGWRLFCPPPGVEIGAATDRRIEWLEGVAHVAGAEVEYAPTNCLDGFYERREV